MALEPNVWKVGSRWSDGGRKGTSILGIFRRNNIVIVGLYDKDQREQFLQIKEGDLIVIADGTKTVAIGKTISKPCYLDEHKQRLKIRDDEKEIFYDDEETRQRRDDWAAVCVKVKIVDLAPKEYFYVPQGTFFQIHQMAQTSRNLYNKSESSFSINSYTTTPGGLKDDTAEIAKALFDGTTKYVIPIYQRGYSWEEAQITRLCKDIITGFQEEDSIFIGTMQMSAKKYVRDDEYWQEIIDGQQRITTITLLLKELQRLYPDNERLKSMKFDWLETRVTGEQQKYLTEYLSAVSAFEHNANPYSIRARIISEYLENEGFGQDNSNINEPIVNIDKKFNIDEFIDYILHRIYFVVIETRAGISKTLDIFDSINTAGLKLNGGDLFKIKMYEYLTDKKGRGEEAFNEIQAIYNKVEQEQARYLNIDKVLMMYKDVIVAKYGLDNGLFNMGTNTFFDRLFNYLLYGDIEKNFESVKDKGIDLSLGDLTNIIENYVQWYEYVKNDAAGYQSKDEMFAYEMVWRSRYWRLIKLAPLYTFFHGSIIDNRDKLFNMFSELNKLSFLYGMRYSKVVSEINTFVSKTLKKAAQDNAYEDIMDFVINKKNEALEWAKAEISKDLKKAPWKKFDCWFSEFLQRKDDLPKESVEEMRNGIFVEPFDIEHIHAINDSENWNDWPLQNSIGNLALLEQKINREIQDKPFNKKCEKYLNSHYAVIKFLSKLEKWTKKDAEKRRESETEKIYNYIFQDSN